MKQLNSRPIDTVDLLSLPVFVGTMVWEARVLARREQREFGDLDDATPEELSDPRLPPDPLVPVGYERRDTAASLAMLAGNVAVNLAIAGGVAAMGRGVSKRRIVDLGRDEVVAARGDGAVGLPLLLGPSLDARGAPALGEPRHPPLE